MLFIFFFKIMFSLRDIGKIIFLSRVTPLSPIAARVCLNFNLLLSIPSVKRIMIVSQKSIVERVICFIKVLFYLVMKYFLSVKLNYLHLFIGQPGCFRHRQGKKYLMEFPFISCVGTLKNPISFSLV